MDLNKILSTAYRWIAVSFLIIIFVIASCYAFLVGFYVISDSWAAPVSLSPSQERVLAFQPQIATMQASLNKQRIDLTTAQATVGALTEQVVQLNGLSMRINEAITAEAASLNAIGVAIDRALALKRADIKQSEAVTGSAYKLLGQVNSELAAKLITSDQAAQRRISLQGALNAVTDSRTQAIQLEEQGRQLRSGSATLSGGSTSLTAIVSVKQLADVKALQAQLNIQLATATATIDALKSSIAENERVLTVAQSSPYYRALREPISVAFMPYTNLDNAKVSEKVYDCYLQVIACHEVGVVKTLYDAEEYARHPLFKTDMRGKLVEIKFTNPDNGKSQVVFIGGKPLFL